MVVCDRQRFPRPKLCAGLLTEKTIRTVEAVFQTGPAALLSAGVIGHATRRYRLAGSDRRAVCGTLDHPFHLTDREVYDHFWLKKAREAGAEFHPQAAVIEIDPEGPSVLTAGGDEFRADLIIGADGVDSRVRRALARRGMLPPARGFETAAALEIRIPRRPDGGFSDEATLYYGFTPWGYAWSFPGPTGQIVGMAGLRQKAAARLRSDFGHFLAALGQSPPPEGRIRSRSLPYGNYLPTPGGRNILLVGDAAGLADPFLGEGIYYAHRSAQLAAEAILACRGRPQSALAVYTARYRRRIYPELRYARAGRQLIFSLPPRFYFPVLAGMLRLMPKICEETIQGRRSFRWFRRLDSAAP